MTGQYVQSARGFRYTLRMDYAPSEAARALARARWGTTRIDAMIAELGQRRDELGPVQRAELRSLVDDHVVETREEHT